jgi:peptide/nickel transport system permease protein
MAQLALDPLSPSPSEGPGTSRPAAKRGRPGLDIVIPAVLLGAVVVACLFGPRLLGLPDPNAQTLTDARLGLGTPGHPLGADGLGRDVLARVLVGGRISLLVGLGAVALGFAVGGVLGLIAGFLGRWTDTVLSRLIDMVLAFPALVLALTIATYLGPSVRNVIVAISFFTVSSYFRLARAGAIALRDRDFVMAARLAGARSGFLLVRHVAPLVFQSLLAYGLLAVGTAILIESGLSFLGLGVQPPQATWGVMISEGKAELALAPHIALAPGIFLFVTMVALNVLGDGVRARVDRRSGAA